VVPTVRSRGNRCPENSVTLADAPQLPDNERPFAVKRDHKLAWGLLIQTVRSWSADYAPSMGAALAFYTLFSIVPLILIALVVAGHFFGPNAARGEIVSQLSALMGRTGAEAVDGLIQSANAPERRSIATGVGIIVFLVGATSVFNELQDALNRIWRAPRSPRAAGLFSFLHMRLLSFGLIVGFLFLLLVSLVVSAMLSTLGRWWGPMFGDKAVLALVTNILFSFILITVLFAMIYKIVPQKKVHWEDVWIGAAITSMLFSVGKGLIGIYLGRSVTVSAFGAVGSLAVFLLWVYYSAQIFLLGAEFTRLYSGLRTGVVPDKQAAPVVSRLP
jgi:membrane protein